MPEDRTILDAQPRSQAYNYPPNYGGLEAEEPCYVSPTTEMKSHPRKRREEGLEESSI